MEKNAKRSHEDQEVEAQQTVDVRVPLPVLSALVAFEEDYLALCVRSGEAVIRLMMEAERTALCGPKWSRTSKGEAVRAGAAGVVQRCQVDKLRNVLEHLPDEARPRVRAEMRKAYDEADWKLAKARLERLVTSRDKQYPGAAASLREGLEETVTLQRLGQNGALYRTLRSTNTIENLNGSIARYTRNPKRWQGGTMVVRRVAAALDHAQPRMRAIRGFKELPKLRAALCASIASNVAMKEKLAA